MEQDHTPASITPNRTVFRFAKVEVIQALREWLQRQGINVPVGELFVWHPNTRSHPDPWALTLGVDHDDPPPVPKQERKGGER